MVHQALNGDPKGVDLVEFHDGPHPLLAVKAVDRSAMAVWAEGDGREPRPLLNFMALAWPGRIADGAG